MCIVQHVELRSVFIFEPKKRLASSSVKCAKPTATFRILFSGTKNQQYFCLAAIALIVLSKRQVVTTKMKTRLLF